MDIPTKAKGKRYWIYVLSAAALITVLHFLVLARYSPLVVLEELYYIPLFFGAFWFGFKGALGTYVLVSLLYFAFFFGEWTTSTIGMADRALHLVFSGIFALTAGFFVDRQRKRGQQAEREKYLAGIGQVAATIVHDLKSPLITILGFGRRIQDRKGNIDTSMRVIMDSAHTMERIVNDVLDVARPVGLKLREEDARVVIGRISDLCTIKAEEKSVRLLVDLPAQAVPVIMDGEQIQRALIALINNAIEASGADQKVVLTVAPTTTHLTVKIKDHGSGMDKDMLDKLFTPFFTSKKDGNGLGMTMAKKIVEAHKGTIKVESMPGTGTTVTVVFPLRWS